MPSPLLRELVDTLGYGLVRVLINLSIHGPGTMDRRSDCDALAGELERAFTAGIGDPLELSIGPECISWCDEPLLATSLQARRLLLLCHTRGVGTICFSRGASGVELEAFLDLLADGKREEAFRVRCGREALVAAGVRRIATRGVEPRRVEPSAPIIGSMRPYQELADVLQQSHVAALRGEEIAVDRANGMVERVLTRLEESPSTLLALATYDQIDSFTVGHSVRVALLAMHVARAAGVPRNGLLRVGTAALLHDIGKSRMPQQVLFKQGDLDADEREIMAMHPRFGAEILIQQRHIDEAAVGAAFCHHMGPNQTGYPTPFLPFSPSGISRLVRICDVFEAITAVRPYKPALTPLQAYALMRRNKGGFDEKMFRFFVRTMGVYAKGTQVVLDDGRPAVVVENGSDPRRPIVKATDGSGEGLPIRIGVADDGVVRQVKAVAPEELVLPKGVGEHVHAGGCCETGTEERS
jgi:putative nucleotidyltransferase with HDIG domain